MQQYKWRSRTLAIVLALILAAAFLATTLTTRAEAWSFDLSASCRLLEDGREVVFTADNTSEPDPLIILDQAPDSGLTSVPARGTASWTLFVPFSDPRVGASWEVLANWERDQRPRHRVASVNFEQECPYVPPTTTTTTTIPPTTTTIPPTTTTIPPTTTTIPPTTTTIPPTTTTRPPTTTTSTTLGTTTTTLGTTTTTLGTTTTTEPEDPCDETHPLYDPDTGLCKLPHTGPEDGVKAIAVIPAENQSGGIDPIIAGLWVALILAVLAAAAAGLAQGNSDE